MASIQRVFPPEQFAGVGRPISFRRYSKIPANWIFNEQELPASEIDPKIFQDSKNDFIGHGVRTKSHNQSGYLAITLNQYCIIPLASVRYLYIL